MTDDIPESDIYGRISARIGTTATNAFFKAFGGRLVYIAKDPRRGSPIVAVIGLEAALVLGDELGGDRFLIPLRQYSGPKERRQRVAELLSEGLSAGQIARACGCHMRTVGRIKGALQREGKLR